MSGKNNGDQKNPEIVPTECNEPSRTRTDEEAEQAERRSTRIQIHGDEKEHGAAVEGPEDKSCHPAGDTKLNISDPEEGDDDGSTKRVERKPRNPQITISEPVNSPCKVEPDLRGRYTCPIYYGIKSYLRDFYQPPDKEALKSGEYIQEDDFRFLVEPGKRRWRTWWLRLTLWIGINLMLIGLIALLVGHLTSPRQTIVNQQQYYTVLDRWAVAFNNRLAICQLAGLAAFTSGAVVVMLVLLVTSYQSPGYYVMTAAVVPESMMAAPQAGFVSRIPLSGSVRGVQPTFIRTG